MKQITLALSFAFSITLLSGCAHWGAHDPHSPPPAPPGQHSPVPPSGPAGQPQP